ncbi:MAG: hypothetical protein KUG77_05870 [Nannocystaceae bacterium]|nr:hypothetical protein [Nannocystaceae bacterium]
MLGTTARLGLCNADPFLALASFACGLFGRKTLGFFASLTLCDFASLTLRGLLSEPLGFDLRLMISMHLRDAIRLEVLEL